MELSLRLNSSFGAYPEGGIFSEISPTFLELFYTSAELEVSPAYGQALFEEWALSIGSFLRFEGYGPQVPCISPWLTSSVPPCTVASSLNLRTSAKSLSAMWSALCKFPTISHFSTNLRSGYPNYQTSATFQNVETVWELNPLESS